jgi:serine/threonine-protein kinase
MERDPFDLVGDVLDGQFRVDAFAGEGDLSVVYKGHHLGVDAPVAIKCLNLPETLDRALARPLIDGFHEASRVHYRLARGNLHIAQTIASGSTLVPRSGVVVPYLVREWFEGESLASDLAWRRSEKLAGRSIEETLDLLETAFDGIAHAHAQGEVHLSINPSNLFVVGHDGPGRGGLSLKVLDFGVARTMNAISSGIAGPRGTRPAGGLRLLFPAYAAPEQLDRNVGELGPWTDVYALALVMMEVLSDRVVMAETETGAIVEHALDELRRPTPQAHGLKLPSHIERALARAVSRAPARRQKSAAELWKDVRSLVRTPAPRAAVFAPAPTSVTPPPVLGTPAPGRARAQTLVGLSPPAVMPVPGATDRSRVTGPTSVVTKPMAFETPGTVPAADASAMIASPSPRPVIVTPGGAAVAVLPDARQPPPSARPAPPTSAPPPPEEIALPPLAVVPPPPTSAAPPPPSRIPPPPQGLPSPTNGPLPIEQESGPVLVKRDPPLETPDRPPAAPAPAGVSLDGLPVQPEPAQAPVVRLPFDYHALLKPFESALEYAFSPRGAPIVLSVAGAFFWMWALGLFLWFSTLRLHHTGSQAEAPPVASEDPAVPATDAPIPAPPEPAATTIAEARTEAPASNVSQNAPAPRAVDSQANNIAAIRALDGKWREIARCRRGKAWGKASTTVTFAADGSVTHVDVGSPFSGTPTGECIADALSRTHAPPLGGDGAEVVYRVWVAPK